MSPVIGTVTCQDIKASHTQQIVNAAPTAGEGDRVHGMLSALVAAGIDGGYTVMGGLPPRELVRIHQVTPLTSPEQELVASWSAPDSWQPGARHPGRGKYLIKTGERLGIPVELSLIGAEYALYDTDPKFESFS